MGVSTERTKDSGLALPLVLFLFDVIMYQQHRVQASFLLSLRYNHKLLLSRAWSPSFGAFKSCNTFFSIWEYKLGIKAVKMSLNLLEICVSKRVQRFHILRVAVKASFNSVRKMKLLGVVYKD